MKNITCNSGKLFLTLTTIFVLSSMLMVSVNALLVQPPINPYIDVDMSTEYYDAIMYTSDRRIVGGYSDFTFRPENAITRDQFAKIIVLSKYTQVEVDGCLDNVFPDVPTYDVYAGYVCLAYQKGLVNGYSWGQFLPKNKITTGEAMKIISNAYGFTDETDVETDPDHLFRPYAMELDLRNAIPSSLKFIDQRINRAELVEIIYRLDNSIIDKSSTTYQELSDYSDNFRTGEANILGLRAHLETPPARSYVNIQGTLPSGCYSISHIEQYREGYTYTINVYTKQDLKSMCIQAVQNFEEEVELNANGITPGNYVISVNGVELNMVVYEVEGDHQSKI